MPAALEAIASELWTADGPPVRFFGFPYPTRMTIARLAGCPAPCAGRAILPTAQCAGTACGVCPMARLTLPIAST